MGSMSEGMNAKASTKGVFYVQPMMQGNTKSERTSGMFWNQVNHSISLHPPAAIVSSNAWSVWGDQVN